MAERSDCRCWRVMMGEDSQRYRIGFDIGGTFTDFVLADAQAGTIRLHKCLTTPEDPSVGVLDGLGELLGATELSLGEICQLVHGTTLVTNAIIERKGSHVALLTTRGFRDTLEFGHEQRYDIHDLFLTFPAELVPRRLRIEVDERISRDGDVIVPIDVEKVRAAVSALVDEGITAVAVCFLHSYKKPTHEQAVRDLIRAEFDSLSVSISSDVQPQLREYERTSTTVANAYVQPLVERYIANLEQAFAQQGFQGRFHLVQSSGGLISPAAAVEFPVRLLESGPAGGGQATAYLGRLLNCPDVISFDMGGTTAKACLIQNGEADVAPMMEAARVNRFKKGSGIPIVAPVIDMIEIGAGGGSIAWVDQMDLLKVGPASAGADPGPACYGRYEIDASAAKATVTDAGLLLGYLNPDNFLGGRMALDLAAAEAAIGEVAGQLSMGPVETAWGIYDIVCENMAAATRVHVVEKGHDPRHYAMVAMGGAGPVHAARVAHKLGISEVIVPPASGAASALGFLASPISFEASRSFPSMLDDLDFEVINGLLAELECQARKLIGDAGVDEASISVRRRAEMRLFGQMHDISIPLPDGLLGSGSAELIRTAFASEYTRRYTELYDGATIQILNWRIECVAPVPAPSFTLAAQTAGVTASRNFRSVYFPEAEGFVDAAVYDRYALRPDDIIQGPAIIEENESTTVLPPGDEVTVDEHLNLRLRIDCDSRLGLGMTPRRSLQDAVSQIESDPIGLEIMWSRLINITEECWETVIRTAFSLLIGEAQDFACEILDAKGNQLAHSPRAMPVFNISLPRAINAMIEKFPVATLAPGDILVTNDPWLCAGHLSDIALATPVFRGDKVVALMGMVGHVTDIGGTKDSLNAREIYDEGLQMPPLKLYRAGVANEDLFALLGENVRNSEQVIGDLHALVAACRLGAKRIVEFLDEYGMHDLEALANVVQDLSERAMRNAIRQLPDGSYSGEIWNDGLGTPERYPIQISVTGDELEVDLSGAPEQQDRGAANCTLNYTVSHVSYPLKCMLSPTVPGNAGCYRPFTINVPEHSILNCDKSLAVNLRARTGWFIASNVFNAMAAAAPRQVQAFTGLPSSALFYGVDHRGHIYNDHLFQGGGQGAWEGSDGKSGLLWPTSAGNTSVEVFETRVPALVLEKTLIPDSGGLGQYRGGLGQRVRARKLYDDDRATHVGLYPTGVGRPTEGLFEGQAGKLGSAGVLDANGDVLRDVGIGALVTLTGPDEIVELCLTGGSGYGPAEKRSGRAIENDLANGYVTSATSHPDHRARLDPPDDGEAAPFHENRPAAE